MYHFFIGSEDEGDQVTLTVFEVESFSRKSIWTLNRLIKTNLRATSG